MEHFHNSGVIYKVFFKQHKSTRPNIIKIHKDFCLSTLDYRSNLNKVHNT